MPELGCLKRIFYSKKYTKLINDHTVIISKQTRGLEFFFSTKCWNFVFLFSTIHYRWSPLKNKDKNIVSSARFLA